MNKALIAIVVCGCGTSFPPPKSDVPAPPDTNDPAFTIQGLQQWYLAGDGVTEIGLQLQLGDDGFVHRRIEDLVAALARALGHIHRDVGIAQQFVRVLGTDEGRDPDAR